MEKKTIDLSGQNGNVFVLIGLATKTAKQLGIDSKPIIADMTSSDYGHAVDVFEKHFGEYYELENRNF